MMYTSDMRNLTRLAVRHGALVPLLLVMGMAPALRADVTLRYSSDVQVAPSLPPEMLKTMQGGGLGERRRSA